MIKTILLTLIIGYIFFELIEHVLFPLFWFYTDRKESLSVEYRACWVKWVRSNNGKIMRERFLCVVSFGRQLVKFLYYRVIEQLFKM